MRRVDPEGSKDSSITLIGEAPGNTETALGRPFVGASGQLLNTNLHNAKIARHACYITNVVKYQPPKNDFSVFWNGKHPTEELKRARQELLQELCEVSSNVFVALGANALWALTGEKKIGNWRGSIIKAALPNGRLIKVIPTYHPSACLRDFSLNPIMVLDLMKAKNESTSPSFDSIPTRDLIIRPTKEQALSYISECKEICSLDIETSLSTILCIGLSYDPKHAISIPLTAEYWGYSNLNTIIKALDKLFRSDVPKVGHNILYDIQYLMRVFQLYIRNYHDTMIMHHTCYSELPKSLAFCASVYTNEPFYKDELKEWRLNVSAEEQLWSYNAKDAAVTLECFYKLQEQLTSLDCWNTYNYTMKLTEPVLYMMLSGLCVDEQAVVEHINSLQNKLREAQETFKTKYGNINPQSPKQLIGLAKSLGISIPTDKGKETMDASAIDKIAMKHPSFMLIKEIRNTSKLIGTYLDFDTDAIDNRLRFSLNCAGTETGRLSSSTSVFGYGYNIQNVPKKLRNIIVPDPGMIFTEVDLVGAEAMVVAYESDDPVLKRYFEEGKNIHALTANLIWGISEEEVLKERDELEKQGRVTESKYFKAKRVRHSGNYRGTWVTLSEQLKIPAAEAKKLLNRFYEQSPNLLKWHKTVASSLLANRTIVTPMGRKRIFFDRYGDQLIRKALAFIAQDTVVTVLNTGIINFYNNVCRKYKDVSVKLQVHDSVLIQHPESMTDMVYEEIKKNFLIPITSSHNVVYTINLSIKSGNNWRDLYEKV